MIPISSYPSGRTIGAGNSAYDTSLTIGSDHDGHRVIVPEGRWLFGQSENFDLGLEVIPPTTIGGIARYSVLNQEDGLALAIHGGVGVTPLITFTAFYLNAGSTLSYRHGQWEPYLVAQQNVSRVNIQGDADSDDFFSFDEEEFDETFLSTSVGLVWWSSEHWGIYFQATMLNGLEGSFQELEDSTLFSIGFTSH